MKFVNKNSQNSNERNKIKTKKNDQNRDHKNKTSQQAKAFGVTQYESNLLFYRFKRKEKMANICTLKFVKSTQKQNKKTVCQDM